MHPSAAELRAWAIGVVGKDPPLPPPAAILGARDIEVLGRRAAMVQVEVDGEPMTYIVQLTRGISPNRSEQVDGDLRAVAWRKGPFTCVAVGRDTSAKAWIAAVVR